MKRLVALASASIALLASTAHADEPSRPKPPPEPHLRVDGGYGVRSLFALPISAGDLGLAAGVRPSGASSVVWGAARGFLGTTESGLAVWSFRLGVEAEAIFFERLRLGAGLSPSLVAVKREARDTFVVGLGIEGRATVRVDLVETDDLAFFLRGSGEAAPMIFRGSGVLWGATAGAGFDFDVGARTRR